MHQQFFNHTEFINVLGHIEESIHAEQVFCSIATQMTFLPQFKDQTDLETIHKENYETSYHRNTAAGNLARLVTGETDEMLILMTVECFVEAKNHDKAAGAALEELKNDNTLDPNDDIWLDGAKIWHRRRKRALRHAAETLHIIIGSELWAKGAKMAES
jgi:hypothetical protein